MAITGRISCLVAVNAVMVQAILLENIANHPHTTTPARPDTLIFLMQELMQMKNNMNILQAVVTNQSAMLLHQANKIDALINISSSNEINNLHSEIAVLKFTVENALADRQHSLNNGNFSDILSKLHNVENAVRQFTFALNEKASKAGLSAIEQRLASLSTSVPQISSHEATMDVLLKNISDRVHALEYDKVIPGRIRLVGGPTPWIGRVEVSYNGSWATVPGNIRTTATFDDRAAQVVCRMLGYPTRSAAAILGTSHYDFGRGTGHIDMSLYGLQCNGSEISLYECPRRPVEPNPLYEHKNDAGVACMDVRLVGGSSPMNGRVEVNFGEGWGTVCDDYWNNNGARVVCRMLGYDGSSQALNGSPTTGGIGVIWLQHMQCTGSETSLAQCKLKNFDIGYATCVHSEDARIICHT